MEPYIRRSCCFNKYTEVRIVDFVACLLACLPANSSILYSLLNDPNTGSPANVEASNLYKDNRKEYTKRVRETVEKSWED
jgi:hypothetical protein